MIANDTTNQQQTPTPPTQRLSSQRYSLIFGGALIVVTLAALIVAFFSSNFRPRGSDALPASWQQTYNADLTASDTGAWDETHGCTLNALGLDANASDATNTSDAQCVFTPSVRENVTAGGFYFVTQLAPAAKVPAYVRSVVSIGDITNPVASGGSVIHFIVAQDGSYTLCDDGCSQSTSGIYQRGGLAAWHGDALVANTIAIHVSPDHSALTVFVNDQQVASVTPQFGEQPGIALGALSGSEAIFTHATLYTGQ